MFAIHSVRSVPFISCLMALFALAGAFLAPVPAVAEDNPTGACLQALLMDSTEVFRGASAAEEDTLVRVEVEQPGVLSLEVTTPVDADSEPRLGFHPCSASTPTVTPLVRSASHMVLRLSQAGSYTFRIGAQDGRPLGDFRVTTGFHKNGQSKLPTNDPIVVDPAPDGKPGQTPDPGSVEEPHTPDPDTPDTGAEDDSLTTAAVCLAGVVDDHGDTASCATRLEPGRPMLGTLHNDWGDDEDVFQIEVDTLQTLIFEVAGSESSPVAALVGRLQDAAGRSLVRRGFDPALGGVGRWSWTLEPGTYYLRLAGRDGAEGSYRLEVSASEW